MEQKQVIAYQMELFDINGQDVVYPYAQREDVNGAQESKDFQVKMAGEQARALVCNLMEFVISPNNLWSAYKQVKQNKGAGERVMQPLSNFIETTLKLKINREKSQVCEVRQSKYLGYTILNNGILTVSKQSIERIKAKVRELTRRNRGVKLEQIISELNLKLRGWLNYFRYAKCHALVQNLDAWIRRKLRCYRIKQCKRVHTMQQFLHRHGVETWQSWILSLSGKGLWRKSGCPQVNQAMGKEWFQRLGLYNLTLNYETFNNLQKPPCTKVRTVV